MCFSYEPLSSSFLPVCRADVSLTYQGSSTCRDSWLPVGADEGGRRRGRRTRIYVIWRGSVVPSKTCVLYHLHSSQNTSIIKWGDCTAVRSVYEAWLWKCQRKTVIAAGHAASDRILLAARCHWNAIDMTDDVVSRPSSSLHWLSWITTVNIICRHRTDHIQDGPTTTCCVLVPCRQTELHQFRRLRPQCKSSTEHLHSGIFSNVNWERLEKICTDT